MYHTNVTVDLMEGSVIQINCGITVKVDVSKKKHKKCKKRNVSEKYYIWNPATCSCENGKYLASIMNDSMITCDEIIESYEKETKNIPTDFNERKVACKTKHFYILHPFLLVTIAFLIAVSTYYYLIKYQAKQKHYHFTTQLTN